MTDSNDGAAGTRADSDATTPAKPEADFRAEYRRLEERWRAQAKADGDVYLPNPEPAGPVDWVFIAMEPSLGGWARSNEEAEAKVAAGFRNFVTGLEPLLLQFSIERYLCRPGERYHVTDVSKGAMPVDQANIDRPGRYDTWGNLLREEIDLVAKPSAGIFALGRNVEKHLATRGFPRAVPLLHYSGNNTAAWKRALAGHEAAFEAFKSTLSL